MNQEFLLQLITAPVVTEKSSIAADLNNQYVFKVDSSANKADIKEIGRASCRERV